MRQLRRYALAAIASGGIVGPLAGQSLLYRPPSSGGTWVPAPGVLQFNFMHRFIVSPGSAKKVTNRPTFTLAMGLGHALSFGTRYSSNSVINPPAPNEFEVLARWRLGAGEGEHGLSLAVTPVFNTAAHSIDGEAAVDFTSGRLTVSGALRGMQKPFGEDGGLAAAAGGLSLRLNDYIALSGDVATFLGRDSAAAWSAGLSFVIPGSPHTFSLHASTVKSNTIQGSSYSPRFSSGRVAYGFEFTIPIHFSRFAPWFHKNKQQYQLVDGPMMNAAATISMRAMKFAVDSVEIRAGESVRWVNNDFVDHTVTFEQPGPTSSGYLRTNGMFVARFEKPGVYRYHCTPHPDMKGVVVVR